MRSLFARLHAIARLLTVEAAEDAPEAFRQTAGEVSADEAKVFLALRTDLNAADIAALRL